MGIIIYLIGLIIAFFLGRSFLREEYGKAYGWGEAWLNIAFSITSFFGLSIILIGYIANKISKIWPKNPPKWM